jgi:hypothetical protein
VQGEVRLKAAIALSLALLLAVTAALAAKAELNAEVPEGKWKALRLRNLAKDASVGVRVESSGPIRVIFLHQDELKRYPNPVRPAFAGSAERRLTFQVRVPAAGNWYVILDNRKGDAAREVRLLIEAAGPAKPKPRPKAQPGSRQPGQAI